MMASTSIADKKVNHSWLERLNFWALLGHYAGTNGHYLGTKQRATAVNRGHQWSSKTLAIIGVSVKILGAGDENRTRVLSLGSRYRKIGVAK
jgi:hypothetical protein